MHDSDFVMACYTDIKSIENTKNKLHIMSDIYFGYIHNLYHNKKDIIDDFFCQHIKPLLKDIDNPVLIQKWRQNIHAAAY